MDDFEKELQAIFDRYNDRMNRSFKRVMIVSALAVIANIALLIFLVYVTVNS